MTPLHQATYLHPPKKVIKAETNKSQKVWADHNTLKYLAVRVCNHVWSYLVKRPQNLLPGIRFEVAIDQMCDHQTGSAWFVGHRWGRGCRDAAQNLLQTSTVDLGGFPRRRICGTERGTTFFFNSSVRVVSGWGQSVVGWGRGGGAGGRKKKTTKNPPKQTNKNPDSELKRRTQVDRRYFSLFWQGESIGKHRLWPLLRDPTLLETLREKRRWMRHIHYVDEK